MVDSIVDMSAVSTHIRMITFIDRKRIHVLFHFDLVFGRVFQFSVVEEPLKNITESVYKVG